MLWKERNETRINGQPKVSQHFLRVSGNGSTRGGTAFAAGNDREYIHTYISVICIINNKNIF